MVDERNEDQYARSSQQMWRQVDGRLAVNCLKSGWLFDGGGITRSHRFRKRKIARDNVQMTGSPILLESGSVGSGGQHARKSSHRPKTIGRLLRFQESGHNIQIEIVPSAKVAHLMIFIPLIEFLNLLCSRCRKVSTAQSAFSYSLIHSFIQTIRCLEIA
jgi:hypothetical protein